MRLLNIMLVVLPDVLSNSLNILDVSNRRMQDKSTLLHFVNKNKQDVPEEGEFTTTLVQQLQT